MLSETQKTELTALVKYNLIRAEETWGKVGEKVMEAVYAADSALIKKAETLPSKIPGHDWVSDAKPTVDEFVALVADIRNSSQHLLCAISKKTAKVSQLQRVYYETSALLPALAQTIRYQDGKVTEYLGDGILALFLISEDKEKSIKSAYRAARDCIEGTRAIVNSEINNRYGLPELNIGVGMSISKAIVTLVGLDGDKHPKAIGECVYRATKLSGGSNEIYVDERLEAAWPTTKNGGLKFSSRTFGEVDGYLVSKKTL